MKDSVVNHSLSNIVKDEDGFYHSFCECGWRSDPCPLSDVDAIKCWSNHFESIYKQLSDEMEIEND